MDKTRIVRTDLFEARSSTGRIYEIEEMTTQTMTTGADGANAGWTQSSRHYQVSSGGHAHKLSHTEFHILASGEEAVRI